MGTVKIDYPVVKVDKDEGYWAFLTTSGEKIFIPIDYLPKQPEFEHKKFWQKNILTMEYIADVNVAAKLNQKELFTLNEKDYPEELSRRIAFIKRCDQRKKEIEAQEDKQICEELGKYIEKLYFPTNFEQELSLLPIVLRAPLKAMFLYGAKQALISDEFDIRSFEKRLYLNFLLFKIVATKYEKTVDIESALGPSFGLLYFDTIVPESYHEDIERIKNFLEKKGTFKGKPIPILAPYYEAEKLVKWNLPKIEDPLLERYLVHLVQTWLFSYARAFFDFDGNATKTNFCHKRLLSDEDEYKLQYRSGIVAFDFSSFIVPKIPIDDFNYFLLNASLR